MPAFAVFLGGVGAEETDFARKSPSFTAGLSERRAQMNLPFGGGEPAYLQLYRALREKIVSGVYAAGAKLPSKRLLAGEAGVSVVTAEHALGILTDEGYIRPVERSGYYVIFRQGEDFTAAGAENTRKTARVSGDIPPRTAGGKEFFPLSGAPEGFPFSVFARTMRRVLSEYGERILIKSPNRGRPELQAAISAYLARNRGISVPPERIVIGSGAEYLYGLVLQLLGRERLYAIEKPSYEKIRAVYAANGVRFEELQMGGDGILSSELEASRATVLHVTPYRSYPTGVSAGASKRQEYLRFAAARGGVVVEDDFDSEFTVSRRMEDTLYALSGGETVLYLNTFSRTIAPAMRVGYLVLPERFSALFEEKLGFYSCTVPTFEQLVLAEFIAGGDFERHINRVRRARREALAKNAKTQDCKQNFAKVLDKAEKL